MARLRRTFLSLLFVTLAYVAYAVCVVPLITPDTADNDTVVDDEQPSQVSSTVTDQFVRELTPLFPKSSWELDHPRVLRSEQITFLLKEFEELEDGRLHVRPCTVVHYGSKTEKGVIGTTIMQAPQGAILEFDKPLRLSSVDFDAKPIAATLVGGIHIVRLSENQGEDLVLETSNVRITRQQIWTRDGVSFRVGNVQGEGSNLLITRAMNSVNSPEDDQLLHDLGTIELQQVQQLSFLSEKDDLFGSFGNPQASTTNSGTSPTPSKITVRCQGPMIIDLNRMKATLEDQVVVSRQREGQPPDTMLATHLWMDFARSQPDPEPTISPNSETATEQQPTLEITRIVAEGKPVVVDARTMPAHVESQRLEYNFLSRELKLFGSNPFGTGLEASDGLVHLRTPQYQMDAPSIEFHNDEDRTRWELHAEGQGRFEGTFDNDSQLQASWTQELHIGPQQGQQVLALRGDAKAELQQSGSMAADEIELWLQPVSKHVGTRLDGTPVLKSSAIPTRLVTRSVTNSKTKIDSPQLSGTLTGIEILFVSNPQPAPQRLEVEQDGSLSPSGLGDAAAERTTPDPTKKNFHIDGGRLTAWVDPQSRDVHRMLLQGHSTIVEKASGTESTDPNSLGSDGTGTDQGPMRLEGDRIDVSIVRGKPIAELSGTPASVASSDLQVAGSKVQFNTQRNLIQIPGPGSLTVMVDNNFLSQAADLNRRGSPSRPDVDRRSTNVAPKVLQPVKVTWQEGLHFDGRVAHVTGTIRATGEDLSFSSNNVQITLAESIDFSQLNSGDVQPTLRHVAAWGGVSFAVQSRDDKNRPKSYQQMVAPNLDIDFVSGDISAEGPGRLSFTSADQLMPSIGTQTTPIDSESTNALTHLAIAFQTRLQGNIRRRDLHLFDNIRMWKGPAPSWTDSVDPTQRVALRKDDVWMSCYELFVLESPTAAPTLQRKPIELLARGEAYVEGQLFAAKGKEIRYAEEKDMLTLEGDVQRPAQLWQRSSPSERGTSQGRVRRIRFWPKSEKAFLDGVLNFDVSAAPAAVQRQ